jgi:hypothetical protein
MAKIINASIDLAKIDKTRITEKNGQKWYQIQVILNDEKDKFGNDVSIQQSQTKEEREAKKTKVYLGNGKVSWSSDTQKINYREEEIKDTDLPF